MSGKAMDNGQTSPVTVYFDGGCPLCQHEIALYRKLRGADAIAWIDVGDTDDALVSSDLSRQDALRRFHVRRKDGQLASGAAGFAELWKALPSLSGPGRVLASPVVCHAAEVVYRLFLIVRPLLQRVVRALK